jgi:preprotein translocase subunit SecG
MLELIIVLLYILFVLAAIVLIVVILLQEGRGGGFGQALGTSGSETFGAGSRGINTFTATTAAVFLGSALLIHVLNRRQADDSVLGNDAGSSAFERDSGFGGPGGPAGSAGQPPPIQIPPSDPTKP